MTLGFNSQLNMLGMGSGMGYQNFLGGGLGMNGFGMNSLFGGCNMFQSCDGSVNYNAMAGMAVGGVVTNCLFGFLGQVVQNRQAKKAEEAANSTQAQLANKLKELNANATVDNYKTYNADSKKYDAAKEATATQQTKVDTLTSELSGLEAGKTAAETAIADLRTELGGTPTPTAERQTAINTLIEGHKETIAEYNKKKADLETEKTQLESLKAKEATEKTAYEAEQQKVDALKAEIAGLIQTQNAETNETVLNKADGHTWQQSKGHFDADGKFTSTEQVKKGDVRYAIQLYRNAKAKAGNDEQVKNYAQQVVTLFDKLSQDDQGDKSLVAAYNIILQDTL